MNLQLKNVTHSFSTSKKILDDISLELEKGKIYALMGANGSGKTTLFNVITGFIKPQSGAIFFNSDRLNGLLPHKINRLGIGRTFQDLRLISKLSVKENVLLAMNGNPTQVWYRAVLPKTVYKSAIDVLEEKADEIITNCFLRDVEYNLAGEISYGQQKLCKRRGDVFARRADCRNQSEISRANSRFIEGIQKNKRLQNGIHFTPAHFYRLLRAAGAKSEFVGGTDGLGFARSRGLLRHRRIHDRHFVAAIRTAFLDKSSGCDAGLFANIARRFVDCAADCG